MKNSLQARVWGVLTLGLAFASTALAQHPPPVSPSDGGVSATPEPKLMIMAVSGLVLAGAYLLWRRSRSHGKSHT